MSRTEKFWNKISGRVTAPGKEVSSPALKFVKSNVKNYVQPDDLIMDFGCGPGDITVILSQNCKTVYALDTSEGMLDVARQKALANQRHNIQFYKTELLDANFDGLAFDAITAFNVLHYIDNSSLLFKQFHTLLKPGGLFISSTACLNEKRSTMRLLVGALLKLKLIPTMRFFKIAELEEEIVKAGFTLVDTQNISGLPERCIVAKKQA